jgi:hypothetical protein
MLTSPIVPTLFYKQSAGGNDAVATAARAIYQSLSQSIRRLAPTIIHFKQAVSDEERKLAHPTISQAYLDGFLDDLSANSLPLSDLEFGSSTTCEQCRILQPTSRVRYEVWVPPIFHIQLHSINFFTLPTTYYSLHNVPSILLQVLSHIGPCY